MAERVYRALVILITLGLLLFTGLLTDCAGSGAFVRVKIPDIKTGKEEVYHLDFRYFQIKRVWRERILGRDEGFVMIVVYCRKHQAYITLLLNEGYLWNYLPNPRANQDIEERLFKAEEYDRWDQKPRGER